MKILTILLTLLLTISTTTDANNELSLAVGQESFNLLCVSCHDASTKGSDRIAPPMMAIKKHYLNNANGEATFIQNMMEFVLNPSAEKSQMLPAIERFGLMPNMGYSKQQLESIASYIYHTDMEQPGRYKQIEIKPPQTDKSYLEIGKQLALESKALLGKNLLSAIQSKGTIGALDFCNENAIELTQTVAKENKVHIKRVSDFNRNPDNLANAEEMAYIMATKEKLAAQLETPAGVTETADKVTAYYPITTNTMCLQCHGKVAEDISMDTYEKIKALYPNDLATGYESNQLRGIWVIEMPKHPASETE